GSALTPGRGRAPREGGGSTAGGGGETRGGACPRREDSVKIVLQGRRSEATGCRCACHAGSTAATAPTTTRAATRRISGPPTTGASDSPVLDATALETAAAAAHPATRPISPPKARPAA